MGHLVVVVGLPGSGKSRWIDQKAGTYATPGRPPSFVHHAFLEGAVFRRSAPPVSPRIGSLREALTRGGTCLIAGVAYTDEVRRGELMDSLADLPRLRTEWVFFENAPEACRRNVVFDERFRARPAAHRLREIDRRAGTYVVPAGFRALPVGSASQETRSHASSTHGRTPADPPARR